MTEDFENELRRQLRPVEAPAGLADRIMAALPKTPPLATVTPISTMATVSRAPQPKPARNYWMPGALAASLVAAVLLGTFNAGKQDDIIAKRDEAAGLEAKRELMEALRVTSKKLDLAYEAVNTPPAAPDEENRT